MRLLVFCLELYCFFGSFIVLYINEGLQKSSKVLDKATEVSEGKTDIDGVVFYTGTVSSTSPVKGDGEYIVRR